MTRTSRRGFLVTAAATSLMIESGVALASGEGKPVSGPAFDDQRPDAPAVRPEEPEWPVREAGAIPLGNNYGGAVKALNTLRSRLMQALNDASTPPYVYAGVKREQLLRTGSVVLREYYFGNLGGSSKGGADVRAKLAASFGTFDAWESEFHKIGQGLGGGSGWVVLGFNGKLKLLENYWMADHATGPVDATPVLVMDMYEHAYQMDYGAAAARYIDAFFANIDWDS